MPELQEHGEWLDEARLQLQDQVDLAATQLGPVTAQLHAAMIGMLSPTAASSSSSAAAAAGPSPGALASDASPTASSRSASQRSPAVPHIGAEAQPAAWSDASKAQRQQLRELHQAASAVVTRLRQVAAAESGMQAAAASFLKKAQELQRLLHRLQQLREAVLPDGVTRATALLREVEAALGISQPPEPACAAAPASEPGPREEDAALQGLGETTPEPALGSGEAPAAAQAQPPVAAASATTRRSVDDEAFHAALRSDPKLSSQARVVLQQVTVILQQVELLAKQAGELSVSTQWGTLPLTLPLVSCPPPLLSSFSRP